MLKNPNVILKQFDLSGKDNPLSSLKVNIKQSKTLVGAIFALIEGEDAPQPIDVTNAIFGVGRKTPTNEQILLFGLLINTYSHD